MKRSKLMMLASMAVLLAAGCGKDEETAQTANSPANSEATTGKKLAKITEFYYYKSEGFGTDGWCTGARMQWSGNNLASITPYEYEHGAPVDEGQQVYTYTGNRLTEMRSTYGECYFTYTDDRLTEVYSTRENSWERQLLTYSADGLLTTITTTNSYENSTSETRLTWSGGNVSAIQEYRDGEWVSTTSFTYDSKKSPYTSLFALQSNEYELLSANNVLRAEKTDASSTETTTRTYTYNGDYPVKCIETEGSEWEDHYTETTTYLEYSDGAGSEVSVPQAYSIDTPQGDEVVLGGGTYASGKTAILSVPDYGFTFSRWSDGNTDNPRSITVNRNMSLTAIFE
ncbi:MAG: hypothetical protein IJU19_07445 [Bacteroidales bacterium]|nr:hypothetical protein [Bacteroidales bacterium]